MLISSEKCVMVRDLERSSLSLPYSTTLEAEAFKLVERAQGMNRRFRRLHHFVVLQIVLPKP